MKKLLAILFFLPLLSQATDYYFAAAGADGNAGTQLSPKQTLAAADVLLRTTGNRVFLNRGDVFYGEIHLNAASTALLAYGSGSDPIITGFITLSSWTSMGSNLYESYCPTCGTTVNVVAFNGADQPVGRYPDTTASNGGYLTLLTGTTTTSLVDSTLGVTNWVGAMANVRDFNFQIDDRAVATQTGFVLGLASALSGTPPHGYGYFLTNHQATLSTIGEYFWKSSVDSLIMDFVGSSPGSNTIQVSNVDTLISLGASSVIIDGVDLKGANKYLIAVTANINNDTVRNGKLSLAGINAIENSSSTIWGKGAIFNISFRDIHSNAISTVYPGEMDSINIKKDSFVNIGIIPGMGASGGSAYSGITIFGYRDSVIQNYFYNIGGVCSSIYGGHANVWRYDFCQHFNTVLCDGGAIYGSVHDGTPNSIWDCIIIDGVGQHYGTSLPANIYSSAIYLDNGAKNWDVERVTGAYCSYNGLFNHFTSNCTHKYNTWFHNTVSQWYSQEDAAPDTMRNNVWIGNRYISQGTSKVVTFYLGPNFTDASKWGTMDSNYYSRPQNEDTSFHNNGGVGTYYNLAGWQAFTGQDAHSHKNQTAISRDAQMILYYNATMTPSVVNLPQGYADVSSAPYAPGPYTLQPFQSIVLIQLPIYSYFMLSQ